MTAQGSAEWRSQGRQKEHRNSRNDAVWHHCASIYLHLYHKHSRVKMSLRDE
jgi:hypothetical protein